MDVGGEYVYSILLRGRRMTLDRISLDGAEKAYMVPTGSNPGFDDLRVDTDNGTAKIQKRNGLTL